MNYSNCSDDPSDVPENCLTTNFRFATKVDPKMRTPFRKLEHAKEAQTRTDSTEHNSTNPQESQSDVSLLFCKPEQLSKSKGKESIHNCIYCIKESDHSS